MSLRNVKLAWADFLDALSQELLMAAENIRNAEHNWQGYTLDEAVVDDDEAVVDELTGGQPVPAGWPNAGWLENEATEAEISPLFQRPIMFGGTPLVKRGLLHCPRHGRTCSGFHSKRPTAGPGLTSGLRFPA